MKLRFFQQDHHAYRRPQPATIPELPDTHFFALYRGARTGGDFYDFAHVGQRVLMLFCDISGERDEALDIAAAVQDTFRQQCQVMFSTPGLNESDQLSELILLVNRTILEAAGRPRYTPAFMACFEAEIGLLTYVNAGHLPALVRDADGISALDASGLPLGLFTHTTHDSRVCVLRPGSSLLLVSKGLVEARMRHEEFGLERVRENLLLTESQDARALCASIQAAAQRFLDDKQPENDLTTLAIVRPLASAQVAAAAS
jgi:serine phosphatase RsbU (regulator of sigma subunit)